MQQKFILPSHGIFPGPVVSTSQQQHVPGRPEGQPVPVNAKVHPMQGLRFFQCQDITPFLVHPQEIIPGPVDKWIMAGKYYLFRLHGPPACCQKVRLHPQHLCFLINLEIFRNGLEKFQRVKTCLIITEQRFLHCKRKVCPFFQFYRQPQLLCRIVFVPQRPAVFLRIQTGRTFLPVAVDLIFVSQDLVPPDRLLIDLRVLLRLFFARAFHKLLVDQAVL